MRRKLLIIAAAAAVVLVAGVAGAALWLRAELETPYLGSKEAVVQIPPRAHAGQVADLLVESGVIHRRLPFLVYLRHANLGRRLQAGEYRFSKPATPGEVARRLARGDVDFRSVTIPEGLTAQETIMLLADHGFGAPGELEKHLQRTDWLHDLDPQAPNLEGYLFPETYRFPRRVDPETVVRTMVRQFRTRMAKIAALHPPRPGWTIRQTVILASLVEEEVKKKEEGPLVASVLLNRLERGMPLGCDATIIYGMKLAGIYQGNIRKTDLAMHSPYNSYIHKGLPPGPITNPGENALKAALNPAATDYLYYVSRNDGTHVFSKNYAAHQRAVDKYQKPLARRR